MVGFPLLLIPLAIYNIIALLMRDFSFETPLITVPLPSGTPWPVTMNDVLLALGILLLLCEVIKGARPGAKYLMDHLLSLLVLCGAGAEFALLSKFSTSTYFLLTTLALADFLSGIALRARRGTHVTSVSTASRRPVPEPDPDPPEPRFDHAPAPVVTATPVVESMPSRRSEPVILLPDPAPNDPAPVEPSPQIPSPGLQPGSGLPPSPDAPPR